MYVSKNTLDVVHYKICLCNLALEIIFQEFTQTRAIDWQALIGNVGGYVGVCLGYTLLHVPMLLANIYSFVIKLTSVRFLH